MAVRASKQRSQGWVAPVDYRELFDVNHCPWDWSFVWAGLLFLGCTAAFAWFVRRPGLGANGFFQGYAVVAFGVSGVWTLAALGGTFLMYSAAGNACSEGRCAVVEGPVEHVEVVKTSRGRTRERFVVAGTHFEYWNEFPQPGFHRISSRGGPIQEGLPVRITHEGQRILRLEANVKGPANLGDHGRYCGPDAGVGNLVVIGLPFLNWPAGVMALSGLMSIINGWWSLAKRYPGTVAIAGRTFRSQSVALRGVRRAYRFAIEVTVGTEGFSLVLPSRLSWRHPPIAIPWRDVEACELPSGTTGWGRLIRLGLSNGRTIFIWGTASNAIYQEWQSYHAAV